MADKEVYIGQSGSVLYDDEEIGLYPSNPLLPTRGLCCEQIYVTTSPLHNLEVPNKEYVDLATIETDPIWVAWITTVRAVNTVFAGPATGPSAVPTFRSLVAADFGTTLSPTFVDINLAGVLKIDDVQVVSNRVVNAGIDDSIEAAFIALYPNASAVLAALQAGIQTHGLITST